MVHSDRGGHYRWPGWLSRMSDAKLTRSMSRKACSPDNAACEGFFGRLKNELFYPRDWRNATIEQFVEALDAPPLVQREADQDFSRLPQPDRIPGEPWAGGIDQSKFLSAPPKWLTSGWKSTHEGRRNLPSYHIHLPSMLFRRRRSSSVNHAAIKPPGLLQMEEGRLHRILSVLCLGGHVTPHNEKAMIGSGGPL